MLAAFDAEIVGYTPDTVRNGGRYKGHAENYQEISVNPQQYVEQGDTSSSSATTSAGARTATSTSRSSTWTFRDGKADAFTEHFDTVRLNEAIGQDLVSPYW